MKHITFVTGVSTSGKSTLCNYINDSEHIRDIHAVDIDGDGRPDAAHWDWLRWRAAQLLYEAHQSDHDNEVICGISLPHAVIDSNAWPAVAKDIKKGKLTVEFALLDVAHSLVKKRLDERLHMKSRAHRERMHRSNKELAAKLRYQVENQYNGIIIPRSVTDPDDIISLLDLGVLI